MSILIHCPSKAYGNCLFIGKEICNYFHGRYRIRVYIQTDFNTNIAKMHPRLIPGATDGGQISGKCRTIKLS